MMSDAIMLLGFPLAAYYITWVIVHSSIAEPIVQRWQFHWEERWIRRRAGDDEELAAQLWEDDWHSRLAYLPTCAWCTGFWVSGALLAVTILFVTVPLWWLFWLGTCGFIGVVDSLTHREA